MIAHTEMDALIAKAHIDEDDVLMLRRSMYGDDHSISQYEADALFRLNDSCEGAKAWSDFFVEAIVDFVVHQAEPTGYMSDKNAAWLIDRVSQSGVVKSATALEALVKAMEAATTVPDALEGFAMAQVKNAVLSGAGPLRSDETLEAGRIGRGEVELLRRVLYACGGDAGVAISRLEAETLFDINDAVTDAMKEPAWLDLFVKANANYLMAVRGHRALSRDEVLRREAWLDDTDAGVGQFFGKILAGGLRGVLDAYDQDDAGRAATLSAEAATAEVVTEDEAGWLVDRIGKNGEINEPERALLMFVKAEAPNIHPRLQPLFDQVA